MTGVRLAPSTPQRRSIVRLQPSRMTRKRFAYPLASDGGIYRAAHVTTIVDRVAELWSQSDDNVVMSSRILTGIHFEPRSPFGVRPHLLKLPKVSALGM